MSGSKTFFAPLPAPRSAFRYGAGLALLALLVCPPAPLAPWVELVDAPFVQTVAGPPDTLDADAVSAALEPIVVVPNKVALVEHIVDSMGASRPAVAEIVDAALEASRTYQVDPYLVLAVVARESSFLPVGNPLTQWQARHHVAPAVDPKKPQGAMQVAARWHLDAFPAGRPAILDVRTNIAVGTRVLHDYLEAESGDVGRALQRYNGNLRDKNQRYAKAVLGFRNLFENVAESSGQT